MSNSGLKSPLTNISLTLRIVVATISDATTKSIVPMCEVLQMRWSVEQLKKLTLLTFFLLTTISSSSLPLKMLELALRATAH